MADVPPAGRRGAAHAGFLACLLALLLVTACSPQRTLEALRLLNDVTAGPGPSRLKEITAEPLRRPLVYRMAGTEFSGDLYRPAEGPAAPLVLVPGAVPAGKDEPRLVAFAKSLARSRYIVLVPEIASLRQLHASATNAEDIAAAVIAVAGQAGTEARAAVTIIAISYAAGPAVIAALDPQAGGLVRQIVTVGGYYDLEAVIAFFMTGNYRESPAAPWRYRPPNTYGKWVFVRSNAPRVTDIRDQVLLTAIAERKLDDPRAVIEDLVALLGPEGRAVHALLDNREPERVPELIAQLPDGIRREVEALDLKRRDLSRLRAEMILLHGRDDPIIPETESMTFATVLAEAETHLYVVDNLIHVAPEPGGFGDDLAFLSAAYRLLSVRDSVLTEDT